MTAAKRVLDLAECGFQDGNRGLGGQTQTLPLYVSDRYENFDLTGAYTAAVLLAILAMLTLVAMRLLARRTGHSQLAIAPDLSDIPLDRSAEVSA